MKALLAMILVFAGCALSRAAEVTVRWNNVNALRYELEWGSQSITNAGFYERGRNCFTDTNFTIQAESGQTHLRVRAIFADDAEISSLESVYYGADLFLHVANPADGVPIPPVIDGPPYIKSSGAANTTRTLTNLTWQCGWQTSVHYNSNDSAWPYRNVCTGHEIITSTNLVDWEIYAVTDRDTFRYAIAKDTNDGTRFFQVGAVLGSGCCAERDTQPEQQPMDSVVRIK